MQLAEIGILVADMKSCAFVVATSMFLTSAAFASERLLEFVPQAGQTVEVVNGNQLILASGSTAAIAVSYWPEDSDNGWIQVSVLNRSDKPFLVQESSLTARVGDVAVRTYTYDDLIRHQKRKAAWRRVGAALSAGANGYSASSAGYSQTNGTYNAHTTASAYGSGGYAEGQATTSGTYSSTTYNPAAAAAARADADAANDRVLSQLQKTVSLERKSLENRVLRANTVKPGSTVMGQIRIDIPQKSMLKREPFSLAFSAGAEEFRFVLAESPR